MENIKALFDGRGLAIINIEDLKAFANIVRSQAIEDYQRSEAEKVTSTGEDGKYLTIEQASEMLQIDRTTLNRWKKRGYLQPVKIGGSVRYRLADIKDKMRDKA